MSIITSFNSVDVIIVNWNAGDQLKDCIESIPRALVSNIIVVDNASVDNSMREISKLSNVTPVFYPENMGFGKACNLGAYQSTSEFILFLNPDSVVYAGSLEKVLSFLQHPHNSSVGICGVQLLDESGNVSRSCARFPTPLRFAAYALGLDRIFPKLGHFMHDWSHDETREVDHVIGAFFLVRREVFQDLGGFDERFFVYLEDLDFSFRARKLGWRSVYLADVQAFHLGGGTSNQIKARRLFYSLRSRLIYSEKHFSGFGTLLVFSTTIVLEPIARSILALSRCSWSSLKETWIGYGMLLRWIPQWIFKGVTR